MAFIYAVELTKVEIQSQDIGEKLTSVTREGILSAIIEFDREFPNTNDYDRWLEEENYKYALVFKNKLYPPKYIMSLVLGIPTSELMGGDSSYGVNRYFRRKRFVITQKPNLQV